MKRYTSVLISMSCLGMLTGCYQIDIPQTVELYEERQAILAAPIPPAHEDLHPIPAGTPLKKYSVNGELAYCANIIISGGGVMPCWKFEGEYLTEYLHGGTFDEPIRFKFVSK